MSRVKGGNYLIDLRSCGLIEEGTIINFSNLDKVLYHQINEIFEEVVINEKQIRIICNNNLFDNNETHSIITINAYKYGDKILSDLIPNSSTQGIITRIVIDFGNEEIKVNKYQY